MVLFHDGLGHIKTAAAGVVDVRQRTIEPGGSTSAVVSHKIIADFIKERTILHRTQQLFHLLDQFELAVVLLRFSHKIEKFVGFNLIIAAHLDEVGNVRTEPITIHRFFLFGLEGGVVKKRGLSRFADFVLVIAAVAFHHADLSLFQKGRETVFQRQEVQFADAEKARDVAGVGSCIVYQLVGINGDEYHGLHRGGFQKLTERLEVLLKLLTLTFRFDFRIFTINRNLGNGLVIHSQNLAVRIVQ